MIGRRVFTSGSELLDFFNGVSIDSGSAGAAAGGVIEFTDATLDAFALVEVGDEITFAEETYLVVLKNSVNSLNLDRVIPAGVALVWRARRGGRDGDITVVDLSQDVDTGRSVLVYRY